MRRSTMCTALVGTLIMGAAPALAQQPMQGPQGQQQMQGQQGPQGQQQMQGPAARPCAAIRTICAQAGFIPQGARAGEGLVVDCIRPIMQGIPQPQRASKALPAIDPQIVEACRAQNPNFGMGNAAQQQGPGMQQGPRMQQAPGQPPAPQDGGPQDDGQPPQNGGPSPH